MVMFFYKLMANVNVHGQSSYGFYEWLTIATTVIASCNYSMQLITVKIVEKLLVGRIYYAILSKLLLREQLNHSMNQISFPFINKKYDNILYLSDL